MLEASKFSSSLPLRNIQITDPFWKKIMERVRTEVIPYQWAALNDQIENAPPSGCMRNFKLAAQITNSEIDHGVAPDAGFYGYVFQDSDFAKWIEAVGYVLTWHPDAELEKTADDAIDLVCSVQQVDGYMDTYYIINGLDERFTNLQDHHELYCLGHLLEGAIAYYEATGKNKLLNAAIRFTDCVNAHFGPEEEKLKGYPGHEVLEMALVHLYQITQNEKHLNLAKYFISQRGQQPLYFKEECRKNNNPFHWEDTVIQYQYYQAGKPVGEQDQAEGHAVRAVYLYAGMASLAKTTQDPQLLSQCVKLWNNIVNRQMYITGGIGQTEHGEAFTFDYDLPNDTIYAETCASIGLAFFARHMVECDPKGIYGDILEKTLYNGILSGMSLDGKSFFYVNPLEVLPEASEKDYCKKHVKIQRQKWFGCACCPPNIARFIASLGAYAYTIGSDTIYCHLYIGSSIQTQINGQNLTIQTESGYPWNGNIRTRFQLDENASFTYMVRIPAWCQNYQVTLNGKNYPATLENGYLRLQRNWRGEDLLELSLEMPVQCFSANPKVRENIGKISVTRGPIVYCLEETDNGKGLHQIYLRRDTPFEILHQENFLEGVTILYTKGDKLTEWEKDQLYQPLGEPHWLEKRLTWIPYYAWANRTPGEMMVWVHTN